MTDAHAPAAVAVTSSAITPQSRPGIPGGRGGVIRPFDSASAAAARRAQLERKAAAVRRGVADAGANIDSIGKRDPYAVIQGAFENHALHAMDPSAPGSQRSLELMLKHGWPEPERGSEVGVPAGGMTITLSPELARAYLAARDRERDGE